MNCSKPELLDKLAEIVGAGWVKTGVDDLDKLAFHWANDEARKIHGLKK